MQQTTAYDAKDQITRLDSWLAIDESLWLYEIEKQNCCKKQFPNALNSIFDRIISRKL